MYENGWVIIEVSKDNIEQKYNRKLTVKRTLL